MGIGMIMADCLIIKQRKILVVFNSGEQNASAIWNPKEPRMQKRVLIRHRHETDCAKAGTVEKQTEIVN